MSKTYNFAVVGCGMLARQAHIPNIAANPRMVLHTCCDVSDESLAECRDKFGALNISKDYVETINNPEIDVVCIATTERLRLPLIQECAKAGKPVYVEKPIAPTLDEAYEIQKVVHASSLPICVGHNRRSSPAMIEAHQIFRRHMDNPQYNGWRWAREGANRTKLEQDGVAGMSVRINDDWHSWKGWVFDGNEIRYGLLLSEMTHFTDICNWFLEAQPVEVTALSTGHLNHGCVIAYENGEIATINMTGNGTFGYPKELYELTGEGGMLVIDHMMEIRSAGIKDAPHRITYPVLGDKCPEVNDSDGITGWLAKRRWGAQQAVEKGDPMLQFACEPDKGHAHQLDRFLDQIEGKCDEVCGIDDAILATRVCFAAIESTKRRQVVRMDEI